MTDTTVHGAVLDRVIRFAMPFIRLAIGSAVIAFVLLLGFMQAGGDPEKIAWFNAVIYGFGWDSTLQKLRQGLNSGHR
jgi:hypothetical protein